MTLLLYPDLLLNDSPILQYFSTILLTLLQRWTVARYHL